MAKIMKDTRQTIDVDTELEKIRKEKKSKEYTKEKKKETKKPKKATKKVEKKAKVRLFSGVRSEMAKVKWPGKKDMVKYSIATIVFVIFFAIFFYCIDLLLALLKEVF